ncbi:amidohydrolase family protein [Vibrio sp. PP-XX7]
MCSQNFAPVAQLPQSPGVAPAKSVVELVRCVEEMGFIGCNLNPDPSGGYWQDTSLADRAFYPLYERDV